MTVAVDPGPRVADYASLPKANVVLVTHGHGDHIHPAALQPLRNGRTVVAANPAAAGKMK